MENKLLTKKVLVIILLIIQDENDRDFLEAIYTDYYPVMKQTAFAIVKQEATAEDIVQDSVIKLIDKINILRKLECNKMVTYIVYTIRNNAIDYSIKESRAAKHSFYGSEDDISEEISDDITPEDLFEIKEQHEKMAEAISKLSKDDQRLLISKYILNKTDAEIGKLLNIEVNSVRVYTFRAKKRALKILYEGGVCDVYETK